MKALHKEAKELAIPLISLNLRMAQHIVERVLYLWQTTGEVLQHPQYEKFRWKRMLCDEELNVSGIFSHVAPNSCLSILQRLIALVESQPDLYLDEMQAHLQEMYDLYIGLSTIWDALTEAGLTQKKVCHLCVYKPCLICSQLYKVAVEHNHATCANFFLSHWC